MFRCVGMHRHCLAHSAEDLEAMDPVTVSTLTAQLLVSKYHPLMVPIEKETDPRAWSEIYRTSVEHFLEPENIKTLGLLT